MLVSSEDKDLLEKISAVKTQAESSSNSVLTGSVVHSRGGEGKQVRSKEGDGDEGGYGTGFDDKDLDGDEGNEEDGSNQSACSSDSSESDDAWLNDLENSIETKET